MRIALVTQSYYPRHGGVTENVHHSALELRRMGHEVTVVTAGYGGALPDLPGVARIGRNVLVPFNGAWVNVTVGAHLARDLDRVWRDLEPDVIHTHCPVAPMLPLLTLLRAPKECRIIGTFHEAAARNFAYWTFKDFLKKAAQRLDVRIAVSRAALSLARKYIQGEYVIIPNGVDCDRFSPGREPVDRLRDGAFNVLYVGRLDRRKGVKHLFNAVSLAARRTDRRIRLVIVGNDGLRRRFLPRVTRRVEVHFAGVVGRDELPRYFASGDVFCSPAVDRESFGIVLLEAMASGVPVIGTSIPGYLTVLTDRYNALVVPPRDSDSLSSAVIELMENDALRAKLSETGRRFAERFQWRNIAERLDHVYRNGSAGDRDLVAESVIPTPYRIQKA